MEAGVHGSPRLWDAARLSEENHNNNGYAIRRKMSLDAAFLGEKEMGAIIAEKLLVRKSKIRSNIQPGTLVSVV